MTREALKGIRKQLGHVQARMAGVLGISRSYYAALECGTRRITDEVGCCARPTRPLLASAWGVQQPQWQRRLSTSPCGTGRAAHAVRLLRKMTKHRRYGTSLPGLSGM